MHFSSIWFLGALAAAALAAPAPESTPPAGPRTEYIQTFSADDCETEPAPVPGIDRGLQYSGITPASGDAVGDCAGMRPDGSYYGAFTVSSPVGLSADYDANPHVKFFDAFSFKFGCARLDNGVYYPANCTVQAQGITEIGVIAQDYYSFYTPSACGPGSTQNYGNLYNYAFETGVYTELQGLVFNLQPDPEPSSGTLIGYLDDIDYNVTLVPPSRRA